MAAAVAVQKAQHVPEALSAPMETEGLAVHDEGDLYTRLKTLQRQLEFLEIQVSNRDRFTQAGGAHCFAFAIGRAWVPFLQLACRFACPLLRSLHFGAPPRPPFGSQAHPPPVPPAASVVLLPIAVVPATSSAQEEYIKEEQKNLKNELLRAQEEVKRIQV